jgi:AcrR family transcriptional regulator
MNSETRQQPEGISRSRVVAAALEVVQADGIDGLSMRALAERLGVKAASLYWHVRDRRELLELLAEAILAEVPAPAAGLGWRAAALATCAGLEAVIGRRRDAARILLEIPGALETSVPHASLQGRLEAAGLAGPEAAATASMMLFHVLAGGVTVPAEPVLETGRPAWIAVDTGSRGVVLRAGTAMQELIQAPHDPRAASPAIVRGDTVVVRRLRGVSRGEIELNPAHPWHFKVQAPTWNTLLDLAAIDVREIHLDSGATKVECILPRPRGMVPIHVSSSVVGVKLRRPPGVAVVAEISTGVVQLRLDDFTVGISTSELHWESSPGAGAGDHYLLRLSGGCVKVSLDADAPVSELAPSAAAKVTARAPSAAALDVVLDGVESRSKQGIRRPNARS